MNPITQQVTRPIRNFIYRQVNPALERGNLHTYFGAHQLENSSTENSIVNLKANVIKFLNRECTADEFTKNFENIFSKDNNRSSEEIRFLKENNQIFFDIAASLLTQPSRDPYMEESKVKVVFLMLLKLKVENICNDQQILEFATNHHEIILRINYHFNSQDHMEMTKKARLFKGLATGLNSQQVLLFESFFNIQIQQVGGRIPNKAMISYRLLLKHKLNIDPQFYKDMVKAILVKFNRNDQLVDYHMELTLRNIFHDNEGWLRDEELEFYQTQVTTLFNLAQYVIPELLSEHGQYIPNEVINNKQLNTHNVNITNQIWEYARTQQNRQPRLVLTPRQDTIQIPLNEEQPVQQIPALGRGVAFEIHNLTNGIEDLALSIIDKAVQELGTNISNFSIDNLRDKFKLLTSDEVQKCEQVLTKILNTPNYRVELEREALPKLAALLNTDSPLWEHHGHTNNSDERWKLWLTQSFLEAAEAYGDGGISCVKGIYERLFTGFRSMHPLIDIMYLGRTIIKDYKDNIATRIKSEELIATVIVRLKATGIKPGENDDNFISELKKTYLEELKGSIQKQIDLKKAELQEKLKQALPNTFDIIIECLNQDNDYFLNNAMESFTASIENIEYINYNQDLGLVEHIKNQLSSVVV